MNVSQQWLNAHSLQLGTGSGRSGCAPLTHYTVEFQECGSGPPVILVPGLAGGMELLSPLAQVLARNYRVISYQLRGEDNCFALRRRFGMEDLVEDLAEFIEWHCLESPTVFGISFGGLVALEFAARFPHRLSGLAVQGVGARFEQGLLQRVAGLILPRYPLPTENPFVNQFFNLLFGRRQRPGPLFQFVTRQCWQTDQGVMAHRFHLVEQFSLAGRLEQIRTPTLVLSGDRDLLVSERSLNELSSGIPGAREVRLAGCGHLAFVTHPHRIGEAFHDFMASHADACLDN